MPNNKDNQGTPLPPTNRPRAVPPPLPPLKRPPTASLAVPPPVLPRTWAYAELHTDPPRPGSLTALGIISLVLALCGVGVNAVVASIFFNLAAHSTPPKPPPLPAPLPAALAPPYTGQTLRSGALPRASRAALLDKMPLDGPFAADRRAMLDRLLAEAGQPLLATASAQSATFTRLSPPATSPSDLWAGVSFSAPGGRVDVDNTSASFLPTANHAAAIRVDRVWVTRGGQTLWAAAAIDDRLAELRAQMPDVTDLQLGELARLLDQGPVPRPKNATSVRFAPPVPNLAHCTWAQPTVLSVMVSGAPRLILADGRSVNAFQTPHGLDPVRGAPRSPPAPPFVPAVRGDPAAMTALAWHALASVLAALLLAVAGIAMLARPAAGAIWHLRWAGVKLILVVLEVLLGGWLYASAAGPDAAPPPQTWAGSPASIPAPQGSMPLIILGILAQCIYPAVVLTLLLSATPARRYLAGAGATYVAAAADPTDRPASRRRRLLWTAFAVAALLALIHLVLAVWVGFREAFDTGRALAHAAVGGAILLTALMGGRILLWVRRVPAPVAARAVRAILLALAVILLPNPAITRAAPPASAPSTRPATDLASADAATLKRAHEILDQVRRARGQAQYLERFAELARLGEPAQLIALDVLAEYNFPNQEMVHILEVEWLARGQRISERNLPQALKHMPTITRRVDLATPRVLALFPHVPEMMPAYVAAINNSNPAIQHATIDLLTKFDPTGNAAVEAVRAAAAVNAAGVPGAINVSDPDYHRMLRRIGPAGVPALIEMSRQPTRYGWLRAARLSVLKAMRPTPGAPFDESLADRVVELYLDPLAQGSPNEQNDTYAPREIRAEALLTLEAMGDRGKALAADLRAGRKPISNTRVKAMASLDAPPALKAALFPDDPSAGVTEQDMTVIRALAELNAQRPRAAVDQALRLLKERDDGARLIAARALAALPDLTPADIPQLIQAMAAPSPRVQRAVAATLLGGRFEYTPEIREFCATWLEKDRGPEQATAVAQWADFPLGRRAMIEALTSRRGNSYSASGTMTKNLAARHPVLRGVYPMGKAWIEIENRAAVGKLIADADADPANAERMLLRAIDGPDRRLAGAAATALLAEPYRDQLGPVTLARARKVTFEEGYLYGNDPLVTAPTPRYPAPAVQTPDSPADDPQDNGPFYRWSWWLTACFAIALTLTASTRLLVLSFRRGA